MAKSIKVHKSDVKVDKTSTQPNHGGLTENSMTKSRTVSTGRGSVVPWDNDAKLVHSGNARGTEWLPEDVKAPDCFDKVNSGGADM